MIRGAIFDLDGTLLDSMAVWAALGERYLRSIGYEPRERLGEVFKTFSTEQAARYYQTHYGVPLSVPEITAGVNAMIHRFYREEVRPKPGAEAFLRQLQSMGVRLCVATANDGALARAALERCGLLDCFSAVFSCADLGLGGKGEPDIFRIALEHLGTEKAETAVFEDALHAAQTARADGFPVVGICDPYEPEQEALRALADCYLTDYRRGERFFAFAAQMGIPAADRGHHSLSR